MARPKNLKNEVKKILSSDGFLEIIKSIRDKHPMKVGLAASATTEQRALYQIKCQEYEAICIMLEGMITSDKQNIPTESTYEDEPKPVYIPKDK